MDARQRRILRTALGAVYDGNYPDLSRVDADIKALFGETEPMEARRRVIELIVDAIAERGEFAGSTRSPSPPSEARVLGERRNTRKIIL
jgi:hypothetical protein